MAAQSLLAKLGMRIGVLGAAASLAVCFPLASGDPSMAAHTDATRIGMYATRATNNGVLGLVVGGVETLDVQGDGATTWIGIPTVSQPALSPVNKGSIYYDRTIQGFMISTNGGAYAPLNNGISFGASIRTITADTTLDASYCTVLVDATSGDVTVTIPTAASATIGTNGRIYNVKRVDTSGNTVTIVRSGGDTLFTTTSGNTSITVAPGTSYQLQANNFGTNWVAI